MPATGCFFRAGDQEAYRDPGIREWPDWLSGRMNPDPRDKTRKARLSASRYLPRSRVREIAPSLSFFPSFFSPFSSFVLYFLCLSLSTYIYPFICPLLLFFLRDLDVTPAGFLPRQRFQDNRRTTDNRASQSVPH